MEMKKAVGFRNIAVHAYDTTDWHIGFAIATERMVDFEHFARAVTSRLDAASA